MLESIKVVAAIEVPPRRQPRSANEDALRFARSCYDHLAGRVGVAVTDGLVAMGHIVLTDEGGEVTPSGERFLSAFGIDLTPWTRRIFCQPCLDWSERRYHLKGLVGARILDRLLELGWLKCVSGSGALQLTSSGRAGLSQTFQIEINNEGVVEYKFVVCRYRLPVNPPPIGSCPPQYEEGYHGLTVRSVADFMVA